MMIAKKLTEYTMPLCLWLFLILHLLSPVAARQNNWPNATLVSHDDSYSTDSAASAFGTVSSRATTLDHVKPTTVV
jgi:hypothetical protein